MQENTFKAGMEAGIEMCRIMLESSLGQPIDSFGHGIGKLDVLKIELDLYKQRISYAEIIG